MVATAAAALTVVLLSPLALEEISSSKGVGWNRLNDIGAAYGFTSAIVSALALVGVAVSLIVQSRQARAEQMQGIRSYYLELVRLESHDELRMNGFEIGTIRESLLRDRLAGMFTGEAGRHYWSRAHASWIASSSGSRVGRRFLAIVDEDHARAITAGPPTRSTVVPSPPAAPVTGRRVRGGHRPAP